MGFFAASRPPDCAHDGLYPLQSELQGCNFRLFRVALRKQHRCTPVLPVAKGPFVTSLTIKQAAQTKAVSTKTIRRWIADGLLPAERLGPRLIRIRPEDLDSVGRRIPSL